MSTSLTKVDADFLIILFENLFGMTFCAKCLAFFQKLWMRELISPEAILSPSQEANTYLVFTELSLLLTHVT